MPLTTIRFWPTSDRVVARARHNSKRHPLFVEFLLGLAVMVFNPGHALAAAGPGITTQPQSQNVVFGTNAVFTVVATGQTPLLYQWSFNTTNLTNSLHVMGATSATLIISNAAATDAGSYQVIVTNSHGSVTSSNAQLAVGAAPLIYPQPQSQIRIAGGTVVFTADVSGTAPLAQQWLFNNVPLTDGGRISGSATGTLTITNLKTTDAGNYTLKVTNAFGSVTAVATLGVLTSATGSIRYVDLNNPKPAPPYNTWANAAITIQGAIDAANPGEEILVTNGVYASGWTVVSGMTNRVAVTMPLVIASVNGPAYTTIDGGATMRCVAMVDGSSLTGFTIANGSTSESGGGARCETTNVLINACVFAGNSAALQGGGIYQGTLANCTLTGNAAAGNAAGYPGGGAAAGSVLKDCLVNANTGSGYGMGAGLFNCLASRCYITSNSAPQTVAGGASHSTLDNCLVANNYAGSQGGGADSCTLVNCTVIGNTANLGAGGGLNSCTATNCIIYFNSFIYALGFGATPDQTNCAFCTLSDCCTWPMPTNAVAGITNAPLFVDSARANYHLYPGWAGIDAGDNGAVVGTTDLDGNSRIVNGTVDLGAFEFQNSPFIEAQPVSQTVHLGEPYVSFSVVAIGPELSFQWRFNGTNLAGATSSGLTIASVQYSNAGAYSVLVTNRYGFGLSDSAGLTVLPPVPPAFTSQPASQLVPVGTNVILSAAASGAPAPSYQWFFNGIRLSESSHYTGTANANLQILSVQTNDTGNYFVTAMNAGGSITSAVATVSVLAPAAIASQPAPQTVLLGGNATFSAAISGSSPLGLQWLFNGTPLSDTERIAGSTTTSLTISSIQTNDAGAYQLVVTNGYNAATSAVAVLTVLVPAAILSPLTNQVAMVFSNVTLSLNAVGSPPLFIQWQKDGTNLTDGGNIIGAQSLSLTIANPQPSDSGQYSVAISNSWGGASSSETLTVVPLFSWGDAIVIPPANATNVIGIGAAGQVVNADFAVRADGSVIGWGNDLYGVLDVPSDATNVISIMAGDEQVIAIRRDGTVASWGFGGSTVPDNATNVVAAALQSYGGCVVLRQDGTLATWGGASTPPPSATNLIAIGAGAWGSCLGVRQDGSIISWGDNSYGQGSPPPQATNIFAVACGDRHTLALRADGTVVAFGLSTIFGNTVPPANATNLVAIAAGQELSTALRADGTAVSFGIEGPAPARLTNCVALAARYYHNLVLVPDPAVRMPPTIVQHPLGAIVQTNQTLILLSQAVGAYPLSYQWYFNGAPLAAQTNRQLLLSPILTAQGGAYQVVITNHFGSVTSSTAVVWTAPVIMMPPATVAAFNSNAFFSVTAMGTAPLSYQWYFNGAPLTDGGRIANSGAPNLIITNFQPGDLGNYTVTVSNLAGAVTSTAAVVTVLNPLISAPPQNQFAYGGSTVSFSVTATGQQPLAYQWQWDGTNLPGATDNPLVLTNIMVDQAGTYSVLVTNDYGQILSSNALLIVMPLGLTLPQPQTQSVLGGATATISVGVSGQPPFYYQWRFNGTNLPGATSNPLQVTNVQVSQAGVYSVVVTNGYGMNISSNATLNVAPLAITLQPSNVVSWVGGSATFRVNVSGVPPFAFDWRCNGADIPGATNSLTLTNLQTSQFGTYSVIVSNAYGTMVSSNAALLLSEVAVWGGSLRETNLTAGLTNVIAICGAAEGQFGYDCMALRSNGTIVTWPANLLGAQTNGVTNMIAIAGAGYALRANDSVVALSYNGANAVAGFTNIAAISAFYGGLLGLRTNGTVISGNVAGVANVPAGLSNVVAIAQGGGFALALRADGTVFAWGNNTYGQTNVPSGLSNVVAVAAGYYNPVALKNDGTVVVWGLNTAGVTNPPATASNIVAIAAGFEHIVALRRDGSVIAWGYNNFGQTNVPPGLTNVVAIAAGQYLSMALIGHGPPVAQAFLAQPMAASNSFRVSLPTQSGRVYSLEYKNDLADPNWVLLPLVPGNGSSVPLVDPAATNSQRFYRVQRW